jgi:hypothetical protein
MRVGVDARACVGYLLELARLQISPRALNLNSTVATGSSSIFCSVGKSSASRNDSCMEAGKQKDMSQAHTQGVLVSHLQEVHYGIEHWHAGELV